MHTILTMHCYADGTDFLILDPEGLFFPEGSENGQILCPNITIIDDNNFEKDHTFSVHITSLEANIFTTDVNHTTVLIVDNEGMYYSQLKSNFLAVKIFLCACTSLSQSQNCPLLLRNTL